MGLFKFQNYSAIKNAQDNPRVEAVVETVNGNLFTVGDNVNVGGRIVKEAQVRFADAAAAQGDVWVAMNIVDKPEVRNYADYSVLVGEYIRAFKLNTLAGELVELSGDLVVPVGATAARGAILVPTNVAIDPAAEQMIWKEVANVGAVGNAGSGAVYLEVTAVTTFGTFTIDNAGVGYEAKIKTR
jgi:hypothetical protein